MNLPPKKTQHVSIIWPLYSTFITDVLLLSSFYGMFLEHSADAGSYTWTLGRYVFEGAPRVGSDLSALWKAPTAHSSFPCLTL